MRLSFRAQWARLASRWTQLPTIQQVVLGYVSYVLVGAACLCLPICVAEPGVSVIDHLFTATSAVSTTGLTTTATGATYSFCGELVVLVLIQLGGLGYMTLGSFTLLAVSGDLSTFRQRIGRSTLNLPQSFDVGGFLKLVVWFTLVTELIGAAALYPLFQRHGSAAPLWDAVFHSVSAFCTAGFGLYANSFEDYRDDVALNVVIGVLSYLGAIGFLVIHDAWKSLLSRQVQTTLTRASFSGARYICLPRAPCCSGWKSQGLRGFPGRGNGWQRPFK